MNLNKFGSPSTTSINLKPYKSGLIKPKAVVNMPPKLNEDIKALKSQVGSQFISVVNQNERSKKTIGISEAITSEWN